MDIKNFDKREALKFAGDLSQLFYVKDYYFNGGKKNGIRAFDVNNGRGLDFTVVVDRSLDILNLRYKGANFSYLSKAGLTSPYFCDSSTDGFLRNFFAGLLTTCGLCNAGLSSVDENGEEFGMHGRISHIPAEDVYGFIDYSSKIPLVRIGGMMRESRLFGENIVLKREILVEIGKNKITINDEIENMGFRREPLFLLYHFNFGYPLLDEDTELLINPKEIIPRTDIAKKGIGTYNVFQKPTKDYQEQVFYHDLNADKDGKTFVGLINKKLLMGMIMKFNKNELDKFVQWKQMGEGEYALGLEPGNCFLSGRANEIKNGDVEYLEAGKTKKITVEIDILDGVEEINSFKKNI